LTTPLRRPESTRYVLVPKLRYIGGVEGGTHLALTAAVPEGLALGAVALPCSGAAPYPI
jgi:hypothetical protein